MKSENSGTPPSGVATEIRDAAGRTVAVVYGTPQEAGQVAYAVNQTVAIQAGPATWVYPHR